MKIAVPQGALRDAGLAPDGAARLGIRCVEATPDEAFDVAGRPDGGALRPCVIDTRRTLGAGADREVPAEEATRWFAAARRWGSAGVVVAVQDAGHPTVAEAIARLGDLARQYGSRLLLAVRPTPTAPHAACHGDLLVLCRRTPGTGIAFDVAAESACGHAPERILRRAEGYVGHVRLPNPVGGEAAPLQGVLRELHRMSYIDAVALYGVDAEGLAGAVIALRDALRAAWLNG